MSGYPRMRVPTVDIGMSGGWVDAWHRHNAAGRLQSLHHTRSIKLLALHNTRHSSRWGGRGHCLNSPPSSKCICYPAFSMLPPYALHFMWFVTMSQLIVPLGSACPPEAKLASFRTALGRRCTLLCCVEFDSGFHHCQGHLHPWLLADPPQVFSPGLSPSTLPTSPLLFPRRLHSPCKVMPRLRHRLRCRRGSTRARPASRRRSPPSPSSSPDSERLRRPSTRVSCRRRALPAHHPPSPPRSVSPHPSEPRIPESALLANPSTALFHFPCVMNQPMVVATISVQFKELPQLNSGPPPPTPPGIRSHELQSAPVMRPTQLNSPRTMERSELGVGNTNPTEAHPKQSDAGEAAIPMQDDDECGYGCRIVEESPSDDYGL